LFFISANSFAQKTVIRILDEKTLEPCQYANVVLYDKDDNYLKGTVSNNNGEVTFEITEESKIIVSYVGYKNYDGLIIPGENKTIHLKPSYFELESVVVTGQYKPQPVDKSIYKIDVVSSKSLEERGVNNLAEALSSQTSIRLNVDPSYGTSVEMQGMSGENVKYLIDGVPIVGRVGGIVDLSQINMENVDHIEIVQGPMSVQYGTSAIAGVVNIITKKNQYFRNLIKANSYIDDKGSYNFGVYGSFIRGKHSVTLSGNRNLFQGVDTDANVDSTDADGHDRYMEFKPKLVYSADANYTFRKKDFNLSVKTQYMNTLVKNYSNVNVASMAYDADFYTTRSINSITLSDKISEKLSFNIIGAYTYFGRKTNLIESNLDQLTKEITGTSRTEFNNIMSRGNFTYTPGEKLSVMTGWDITYDNGNGDKIEDGAEIGDYAAYLSGQYKPGKKFSIQPGIRFIYNTIYGAPLIPSLNIQYSPIKFINLRLSYARGFRAPSLKELYLDFKDSNHDLSGNKDLRAETTNSYNASVSFKIQKENYNFKIEPTGFYNDGKDAITLIVTDIEANQATNINMGKRITYGGDLNASFSHRSGFSTGAGFSRTYKTSKWLEEDDYLPVFGYNNYSFNTKYFFRKLNGSVMANLKWYDQTPMLASIPEEDGGGYYNVFTESYGDLEISISKNLLKNKLSLVIGGKNLLNYSNIRNYGYQDFGQDNFQPEYYNPKYYGRIFFIKLNFKLNS
jgi:outer membrane receptor for ferrienterochelin and colicins